MHNDKPTANPTTTPGKGGPPATGKPGRKADDGPANSTPAPIEGLRGKVAFWLVDTSTLGGKLVDVTIIAVNLLAIIVYIIDMEYHSNLSARQENILYTLEMISLVVFCVEYLMRLWASEKRLRFLVEPMSIIDLISILGFFSLTHDFRFLRAFRIFRFLRFQRFLQDNEFFFGAINAIELQILRIAFSILSIVFVAGALFYDFERVVNTNINTLLDGFYYAVTTMTTVGFGDIVPQTSAGRWITISIIFSGITIIPVQAARLLRLWQADVTRADVVCASCGLRYHDHDATHCKGCGNVIYQEFDNL